MTKGKSVPTKKLCEIYMLPAEVLVEKCHKLKAVI